ncbi:MAG: response regulator transcription factor [Thermomicrobiales bacterium]
MGQSVLVVDDERFIVELIADILQDEGFDVDRAYDGLQAELAIERSPPDLVIADVMMPKMDGLSLARRLGKRSDRIPILLMSAVRRPIDPDIPFLAKPFDVADLIEKVHVLTNHNGAAVPA